MYFNELSGPIFGWINTKVYDKTLAETKDELKAEQTAVGWCGQVLDTNGDGKITRPWNNGEPMRSAATSCCTRATPVAAALRRLPRRRCAVQRAGGGGWPVADGRGGPAAPFDPKLDTHGSLQPVLRDPEPG